MAKILFENSGDVISLEDGSAITEICEEAGVPFACTEGVCGTCVIEVREGMENLTPQTPEERDFLGEEPGCERLACQCKIRTGAVKLSI